MPKPSDGTSLTTKALLFASRCHRGQLRKDSSPYITHPIGVESLTMLFRKNLRGVAAMADANVMSAVAYLHDTVEDGHTTWDEIEENFGWEVAVGVQFLTRVKPMSYSDYVSRIMAAPEWVIVIKLADVCHNLIGVNQIYEGESLRRRYEGTRDRLLVALPVLTDLVRSLD